jgi:hypothetical protein
MARVKQILQSPAAGEAVTTVTSGAVSARRIPDTEPDATQSGSLQLTLPALSSAAAVRQASLRITGKTFHGLLKYLSGANVAASPVTYDSNGSPQSSVSGQQAFLIDFTGIRSVLGLSMQSLGSITLVLPWAGTEFASKATYPVPSGAGPFSPIPDDSGKASVGFAGLDTVKLLVQVKSASALTVDSFSGDCRLVTGTFPSNLKASINQRPPFFTRPGVLNGDADVTGMAADLNAAISAAASPQPLQLTIATDTPGVLIATFDATRDLSVQLSSIAQFGAQTTTDLNLEALAPQNVALSFPTQSPASWKLSRLELDLSGTFPVWRAFSAQASDVPGALGLRVNAQFSVARRFPFAEDGDLYGFSLLFRAPSEAAEMHLELVADNAGQPGTSPPVAAADLPVPAGADGTTAWAKALFASPVKISPQQPMWLTLRAKTGAVEWAGAAQAGGPDVVTVLNNEGGSWQAYPFINGQAPVAMARVLRRPFTKENQPLLAFALQNQTATAELVSSAAAPAIDFAPGAEPVLAPASGSVSASLSVTALAAGKLTIRKARAFYQEVTP